MFRDLALLVCAAALIEVYVFDGRYVNTALHMGERILRAFGF